ncbi:tetraacyldisaccharide 4'-kinase [bacterium]|nr:tetraacyldisaccharide 4'-kinase [bacterium]
MLNRLRPICLYLCKAPALLYGALIAARNLAYDLLPSLSKSITLPTICIGNITTGGTGKTPMVAFLTRYFQENDLQVAILSRGYGRRHPETQKVITPESHTDDLSTELIGDEALMLYNQLTNITLVLDGNRVRGAEKIVQDNRADIVLLDDGFQHRRLRRDFNLIMIDSQRVFGNQCLLPAGPLRETLSALKRADAVIFNKFDQHHPKFYTHAAQILNYVAPSKLFCASYHYKKFTSITDGRSKSLTEIRKMGSFCAVAGLANNNYFFSQLTASGIKVKASLSFKDHHVYNYNDLTNIKDMCKGLPLLTTAKDADKLKTLSAEFDEQFIQNIWLAEIELTIKDPDRFFNLFNKFLPAKSKAIL